MTNKLVIVESPTKAKTIEKFLGKTFTVRASMGHLRDLPKSQFGVDVEHHFTPKYINIRGKGPLIKELKTLAKKADKIYLATDPAREGEAIAWHLSYILGVDPAAPCRISFHEITQTAIKGALKDPQSIDMDKVDAQQTRRILDRIVGYQLSPLLWRKIRKGLSAGRVQSVAVKIICDRQLIDDFEPEEYWTSSVVLAPGKTPKITADVVKRDGKKLEIHNREEADQVTEDLKKASYQVTDCSVRDRLRKPAPPFTTSSLQQEANKKMNFSTKKVMMLAQQLYEGVTLGRKGSVGLITYMRTDSVHLADAAVSEIRGYVDANYGPSYLPKKPNVYSSRKNAQEAHEAIRPTSVSRTPEDVAPYLDRDQLRLYTLIWKRTVASQMASSVSTLTTLTIAGDNYELRATGSVVKFDGFLKLADRKDEEKDKKVPALEKGTAMNLIRVNEAVQHFTEPPANFTEATLVKELEEKGSLEKKTEMKRETAESILAKTDLSKSMPKEVYEERLKELQKKMEHLHGELYRRRIPVVLGFEGWDAGGKGGAIKRLTSHMDPRGYVVNPTASPSDTEKAHHYLWRFWRAMPKAGHIAIFDRTWYGRVMVERIEGFCTEKEWKRAYGEINAMEQDLVNAGAIVLKFWMQIDKDEQARRFKARQENPKKQWKITDEDWRNREKWDQYEVAVEEMLEKTSMPHAPWIVVEGNDKYYARIKVLECVTEAIEKRLKEERK